jgi:hypothetical protein
MSGSAYLRHDFKLSPLRATATDATLAVRRRFLMTVILVSGGEISKPLQKNLSSAEGPELYFNIMVE